MGTVTPGKSASAAEKSPAGEEQEAPEAPV